MVGRFSATNWKKIALIGLVAAPAGFMTVAITFAGVARPSQAQKIATWVPWDARVAGHAAYSSLQRATSKKDFGKAEQHARKAILRDPTNIAAIRSLGTLRLVSKDDKSASRLFRYSERLSSRDLPTRLWLIEDEVQRKNVSGALRHFDIALRTSKSAPSILLPVLVSASNDKALLPSIKRLAAARPQWRHQFLEQLIGTGKSPEAMVAISDGLLNPRVASDRLLINALLTKLISLGRLDLAFRVFERMDGAGRNGSLVRDGAMQATNDFPPFDWSLAADEDLSAEKHVRDNSETNLALFLTAANGRSGDVARQLLRLPAGRFQLSFTSGGPRTKDGGLPEAVLSCAAKSSTMLVSQPLAPSEGNGRNVSRDFAVPGGDCQYQWLAIRFNSSNSEAGSPFWIDDVRVAPAQ